MTQLAPKVNKYTETFEENLLKLFFLCDLCGKKDFCKRSNAIEALLHVTCCVKNGTLRLRFAKHPRGTGQARNYTLPKLHRDNVDAVEGTNFSSLIEST